jgi:Galactose oxidase, central domain/Kelch motif
MENPNRRRLLRINTLKGSYTGSWEEIRVFPPLPPRRSYHSACVYENKMILYGGIDIVEGVYSDLWVFKFNTQSTMSEYWENISATGDLPGNLCRHSAIIYEKKMFLYGGNDGGNENNYLYVLDLESYHWTRFLAEIPPIDSHSVVVYNSKMIIFGGYIGGNLSNDIFLFDLERHAWSIPEINSKPSARADHQSVLYEGHMWVYGGKNSDERFEDLWKLNLDTFVWTQIHFGGESPGTVSGHTICAYGDVMLVFGGIRDILKETNEMHTYDFFNNNWALIQTETQVEDPVTSTELNEFNKKSKKKDTLEPAKNNLYNGPPSPMQGRISGRIPHSRDGHTACLYENYMIVFGGDRHQMAFNDLYCYCVTEKPSV